MQERYERIRSIALTTHQDDWNFNVTLTSCASTFVYVDARMPLFSLLVLTRHTNWNTFHWWGSKVHYTGKSERDAKTSSVKHGRNRKKVNSLLLVRWWVVFYCHHMYQLVSLETTHDEREGSQYFCLFVQGTSDYKEIHLQQWQREKEKRRMHVKCMFNLRVNFNHSLRVKKKKSVTDGCRELYDAVSHKHFTLVSLWEKESMCVCCLVDLAESGRASCAPVGRLNGRSP